LFVVAPATPKARYTSLQSKKDNIIITFHLLNTTCTTWHNGLISLLASNK
jgi:hypothetical protein